MKRFPYHKKLYVFSIFSLMLLLTSGGSPGQARAQATWQKKVDPRVMESTSQGETEFIVFLEVQADLSGATALPTKLEKGLFVYEKLSETAHSTQAPLLKALRASGVEYRPFWVANMVWVRGSGSVVQSLASRSDVAHIYANPQVRFTSPSAPAFENIPNSADTIEWNIQQVNADDVWAAGFNGQGAVIGGQDTGYDWDHPALINQYRGWDGVAADHNYNWHDAIHSGGGVCSADSPAPCDDHGHGTHTMGTMVGDDGDTHQIGMAPGARWIGCRNMDRGVGSPITYAECYQWFIAPTNLNGESPRPDLAPDVINNSWSCPVNEGCTEPDVLLSVVNNVRAAGILTVHSAGNGGPSCSSVSEPATIYEASFSVGATDASDQIASFSSRGPVTVDSSNRLKPQVSAPGVNINSSTRGGLYSRLSGTSMAAPHVTGLAALLVSANPSLRGQVDLLEQVIEQSAMPLTTSQTCGETPGSSIPNNTYGWGRIDALAAMKRVILPQLVLTKQAMPDIVPPHGMITYTLDLTNQLYTSTSNIILTDTLPSGTSLITATLPFSMNGSTLRWEFPSLDDGASKQVQLVVQAPSNGYVVNDRYAARSDQSAITGTPVVVKAGYWTWIPWLPWSP